MKQEKIINDAVFGTIKLPRVCVKIMDTPEFQRLRYIQQLGCSTFVYPSATHNRFQHSIGVLYVARKMVESLKEKQCCVSEDVRITDTDVVCVAVAALCHDLGHGPFSHTWEHFMQRARPEMLWKHESTSVAMFQRIWNKLDPSDRWPLEDVDRIFIEELICGVNNPFGTIVANKLTGIDVDRLAYMQQDSLYLGIKNTFDFTRLIELAQVVPVNGWNSICFKISEILSIYDFFKTRWSLHRVAYRHRVARLIEAMLVDALVLADASLLTTGKGGVKLQISETVDDLDAFVKMVDSIYQRILFELPDDHEAHVLLDRIQNRNLYKEVGKKLLPKGFHVSVERVTEQLLQTGENLNSKDFCVQIEHFDYGTNGKDPIDVVHFYDIDGSVPVHVSQFEASKRSEVSHLLPEAFEEDLLLVMCKKNDPHIFSAIKKAFEYWVQQNVPGPDNLVENGFCDAH